MWRLSTKAADSFFSGLNHCKYYCLIEDKNGQLFVKSHRMSTEYALSSLNGMLMEEQNDSTSSPVNICNFCKK